jgi:hypothetical protein
MPLYPIVNIKTGEEKELQISIEEWVKWSEENKDDWKRDWSKGGSSPISEVGDWRNKTSDGWNDVLRKVGTVPGSKVKPLK